MRKNSRWSLAADSVDTISYIHYLHYRKLRLRASFSFWDCWFPHCQSRQKRSVKGFFDLFLLYQSHLGKCDTPLIVNKHSNSDNRYGAGAGRFWPFWSVNHLQGVRIHPQIPSLSHYLQWGTFMIFLLIENNFFTFLFLVCFVYQDKYLFCSAIC